jgi:hypothetical protein
MRNFHVFNHLLYTAATTWICHIPHLGPEKHETMLSSRMDRVDRELGDQCVISGFRRMVNQIFALLGCYTV